MIIIEEPNYDEKWLSIREDIPVLKMNIEKTYRFVQKSVDIQNSIFIYGSLAGLVILLFGVVPVLKEFAEAFRVSCPVVYWICLLISVLGLVLVLLIRPSLSNYPKGHSKESYEQEYRLLLETLEQLESCDNCVNASALWYKISRLFLSDSPWHSHLAKGITDKVDILYDIKKIAGVDELVSYKITLDNEIKFTYVDEKGDVYTSEAYSCVIKENTKIKHPVLSVTYDGLMMTIPYTGELSDA